MTVNNSYKNYISGFLLVLYVFVATPVQLWHHHNYLSTASACASDKNETTSFSKSVSKSVEANCEICSHQYTTYIDSTFIIFTAQPLFFTITKEGFLYTVIPSSPIFIFLNKSPPALA